MGRRAQFFPLHISHFYKTSLGSAMSILFTFNWKTLHRKIFSWICYYYSYYYYIKVLHLCQATEIGGGILRRVRSETDVHSWNSSMLRRVPIKPWGDLPSCQWMNRDPTGKCQPWYRCVSLITVNGLSVWESPLWQNPSPDASDEVKIGTIWRRAITKLSRIPSDDVRGGITDDCNKKPTI